MLFLFSVTLFVSATLLFLVQPMFAKMALPFLGGTPAVWNTCMVFYQAVLLVGYTYAHVASRRLSLRKQVLLQGVVLVLPILVLPIGIPAGWAPPVDRHPIPWLLLLLFVQMGLPFFAVSTTAPLLQRWFSCTAHRAAADPYFLYAASNVGSVLALLGYPFLLEPLLTLGGQSRLWSSVYGLYALLVVGCGVAVWRRGTLSESAQIETIETPKPRTSERFRWLALAFVPSTLLLGVTTHISTDLAAVPLLWVIPLVLYLVSFILVFARRMIVPHGLMLWMQPLLLLGLAVTMFFQVGHVVWLLLPLHFGAFFVTGMVCHGELARRRPAARYLTEFYLVMSAGGVLGGFFNALAAPLLFNEVVEYPMALILACLLRPRTEETSTPKQRVYDFVLPMALLAAVVAVAFTIQATHVFVAAQIALLGATAMVCYSFVRRPLRFGLGLAAILVASPIISLADRDVLLRHRNFFGVTRVKKEATGCHVLVHGNTIHGAQSIESARAADPLTYYHRGTLVGHLFLHEQDRADARPIAVVGLGAGTLSAYAREGQEWTYYEIDPAMEQMARDSRYFTYLHNCPVPVRVVLGDARRTLAKAPEAHYGIIVLDAFSSDAIPVHLITREALRVYLAKLAPEGVLAFHISNRYFHLQPVLAALATEADLAWLAQERDESIRTSDPMEYDAEWVLMARRVEDLRLLVEEKRWKMGTPVSGTSVWTDDYSNVLQVLKK